MKTNGNNPPSPNERTSESIRQRRSPKLSNLVFRETTQTAHEIRNGTHAKEFYLRHGLLHESAKTK